MTTTDLVDRLTAHRTLGSAPREELEWLAAHGTLHDLAEGDFVAEKGKPVDEMFVVLSGHVAFFADRGAGRHKVMEWRGGDVTGVLPYSRLKSAPGFSIAQETTTYLAIHRDDMREMIRECHEITGLLVHAMLDRARVFNVADLHDEKMVSLGKLSAGLAHELNNPASAIERSAALLESRMNEAVEAAHALGMAQLTPPQRVAADGIRNSCLAARVQGVRSPVAQLEHEEAIADWLDRHGVDSSTLDALADTGVTIDALDAVARAIDGPSLNAAVRWAATGCSARHLTSEIQEAATRIATLVAAIKGFTHMDQASVAEPVEIGRGLENTVAVLRSKARGKSATVTVEIDPGLPRVRGFAGELNQIWSNLIDNALDAVPTGGHVNVRAAVERRQVIVHVIDDGPGIPDDIAGRIFDPFFSTKPVGLGTGLGLDIVRRLVTHNDGEIAVESRPGRTVFRVALPTAETASGDHS
ncbi:MAG TPA: ATP-binding protein [Vicinamibacterales bacterium]|jgi:signal transduction histidine kinase